MAEEDDTMKFCVSMDKYSLEEQLNMENKEAKQLNNDTLTTKADAAVFSHNIQNECCDEKKVLEQLQKQQQRQRHLLKKLFRVRKQSTHKDNSPHHKAEHQDKKQNRKELEGEIVQEKVQNGESSPHGELRNNPKDGKQIDSETQGVAMDGRNTNDEKPNRNMKNDLDDLWKRHKSHRKDTRPHKKVRSWTQPYNETTYKSADDGMLHGSPYLTSRSRSSPNNYQNLSRFEDEHVFPTIHQQRQDRLESVTQGAAETETQSSRSKQNPDILCENETDLPPKLTTSRSLTHLAYRKKHSEKHHNFPCLSGADIDIGKNLQSEDGEHKMHSDLIPDILVKKHSLNTLQVKHGASNPVSLSSNKLCTSRKSRDLQSEHKWQEGRRDRSLVHPNQRRAASRSVSRKRQEPERQTNLIQVNTPEDHIPSLNQYELQLESKNSDSNFLHSQHIHVDDLGFKNTKNVQQKRQEMTKDLDPLSKRQDRTNIVDVAISAASLSSSWEGIISPTLARSRSDTCHRVLGVSVSTQKDEELEENPPDTLVPGCYWYPLLVDRPSIDSSPENECVRTEVVAHAYRRRKIPKQSSSPLGLPLRFVSQPLEPDTINETEPDETLKSDSFKTVPLRIKRTPPNSKHIWKVGKKRNAAHAGFLESQDPSTKNVPPGAGFRVAPRQQNLHPKNANSEKLCGIEKISGDTNISPSPRRISLVERARSPSKFSPNPQTRSSGRCLKTRYTRDKSNLLTKPNKRSLSAGPVESRLNPRPLNTAPAERDSSQARRPTWKRNVTGVCDSRSKPPCVLLAEKHSTLSNPRSSKGKSVELKPGSRETNVQRSIKSHDSPNKPGTLIASRDTFGRWTVCPIDQAIVANELMKELTDAEKDKKYICNFKPDSLKRVNAPGSFDSRLVVKEAFSKSTKIVTTTRCMSIPSERSRDPLLRFYHLPNSLRALRRREMGVFESMSLPVVCIDRDAILEEIEEQMDTFKFPPQLPSCPQESQECNMADNKAADATRVSTSPAYKSLLNSKSGPAQSLSSNPEDALTLPILGLKDGLWIKDSVSGVTECLVETCVSQSKTSKSKSRPSVKPRSLQTTKRSIFVTPPTRPRCASQNLKPASAGSWIKRRKMATCADKKPITSNPTLEALTKSPPFLDSKLKDGPDGVDKKPGEEHAGDDTVGNSASLSLAKSPRLHRRNSIVLSVCPGKDRNVETNVSASGSFSYNKQNYITNHEDMGTQPKLTESGSLLQMHEDAQGYRIWIRVLIISLFLVVSLVGLYFYSDFNWDLLQ